MKRRLIVPYLILSLAIFAACGGGDDTEDAADEAGETVEAIATDVDAEREATEADIGADDAETPETDVAETPELDVTPEIDTTPETDLTGTPEVDTTPETDMTEAPESDITPEADVTGTPDTDTTPETDVNETPEVDTTPDSAAGAEDTSVTFSMGEAFLVGLPYRVTEVMVTVDEAMMIESIEGVEPEPGAQFVGVTVTVVNATSERLPLAQFLGTVSLMDASDEWYPASLQATTSSMLDGGFEEDVIEPGEEAQGIVVFEVPEDASDLTLVFGPSAGEESIVVELELTED